MIITSYLLMVLFVFSILLPILCSAVLSVAEIRVFESPAIIVISVLSFSSVSFSFMCFEALLVMLINFFTLKSTLSDTNVAFLFSFDYLHDTYF